MENSFLTLINGAKGEITEKKSRFIADIIRVQTETEALAHIERIKKLHRDARHNCWAYILSSGDISRSSDDGEPAGSAGRPILDVLGGHGLCDVCAVVTRYFGGTLLGVGGLVRAYSAAVEEALLDAETLKLTKCSRLEVRTGYGDLGKVRKLIERSGAKQLSSDYGEQIIFDIAVRSGAAGSLCADITEATAARAEISDKGECYEAL